MILSKLKLNHGISAFNRYLDSIHGVDNTHSPCRGLGAFTEVISYPSPPPKTLASVFFQQTKHFAVPSLEMLDPLFHGSLAHLFQASAPRAPSPRGSVSDSFLT